MIEVRISNDGMTAEVCVLPDPDPETEFPEELEEGQSGDAQEEKTTEELSEQLIENTMRLEGVQAGIDKKAIAQILKNHTFGVFVPVAQGKPPVNGKDGYYEYYFITNVNDGAPRVRADGSVDYSKVIANVNEGDLIAKYYPETNGSYGYNVYAKTLPPLRGKPARPLRLKNVREEDNQFYATKNGNASLSDNALSVQNILEVDGDANYTFGNIKFNGDVHVAGNIDGGVTVQAMGSIIVDGVIEDAKVSAGQDIMVGRGVHGQGTFKDGVLLQEGTTMVEAKGSIQSTFVDHAFVKAVGNVTVDYAIGSVIETDGKVTASGKRGAIMGGRTTAVLGIEADYLGNQAELPTEFHLADCSKIIDNITSARQQLKSMEEKAAETSAGEKPEYLRNMITAVKKQLADLEEKLKERQSAPAIVHKMIYPNVKLRFGDMRAPDMSGKYDREIRKIGGNILCKAIGSYTEAELAFGVLSMNTQVLATDKTKILVIDDDARLLRTVHRLLEEDYQVAVATSGNAGRKYLEKNTAELILLDYMMPDENGVEVLNSLRAWDKTKDIPVVFLTGLNDKKKIMECLALHPAGYIIKPVEREGLLAKIRAILGQQA